MKKFLSKLHNSRGEMLLEALVAIVIVVLCISMLSTAMLTANKNTAATNTTETVRVLSGGSDAAGEDSDSDQVVAKFINTSHVYTGEPLGMDVKLSRLSIDGLEKTADKIQYQADNGDWLDWTATQKPTFTDVKAGGYTVQLKIQVGDQVYTKSYNYTVSKRIVTLTSGSSTAVYDNSTLTNSVVTPGGDGFATGEGATYTVTGSCVSVGTAKNLFTYTLNEGTKAGNYSISVVYGVLELIDASANNLTISNAEFKSSQVYTYDGTPQGTVPVIKTRDGTQTATVNYLQANGDWTPDPIYLTDVGEKTVQYMAYVDGDNSLSLEGSYTITVNQKELKLKAKSYDKEYDGTALTALTAGYEIIGDTSLATGDTLTVTYSDASTQTEIGKTASEITSYKITRVEGTETKDVTSNYEVSLNPGTLTVNPIAVTLTAVDKKKDVTDTSAVSYTITSSVGTVDNSAKTVTVTIGNTQNTEVIPYSVSSSGTAVGTYPINVSVTGTGATQTTDGVRYGHCLITLVPGTLTINQSYTDEDYQNALNKAVDDFKKSIYSFYFEETTTGYAKEDDEFPQEQGPENDKYTQNSPYVLRTDYVQPDATTTTTKSKLSGDHGYGKEASDYPFYQFIKEAVEEVDSKNGTSIAVTDESFDATRKDKDPYDAPITVTYTVSRQQTDTWYWRNKYDYRYNFTVTLKSGSYTQTVNGYVYKKDVNVSYDYWNSTKKESSCTVQKYYWSRGPGKSNEWIQTGTKTTETGTYDFYWRTQTTLYNGKY